ncbi:MAG TPA: nucleoside recognition domain-containing protein [Bacillota bacterium]|nr:nucleoside recognition domain-containing protein [Bacillota bacterium]
MLNILQRGFLNGVNITWTLGKVIFPITLLVTILQHTPILPWVTKWLTPIMGILGLPGEAAVPLVLGNALNLYAAIGAIVTFDFTVKEVFIMAMMLSFSHNLFIESAVAARVGVSWWLISGVRIGLALISGLLINWLWRGGSQMAQYGFIQSPEEVVTGWSQIVIQGFYKAFMAVIQLAIIVIILMMVMQYLRELGFLDKISKLLTPMTRILGMEKNASMTLVAGLTVGLAFGAGLMIQAMREDGVSKKDMILALIFLVSCHAVIEDTVIFIPLGIPVLPLLFIRLITAFVLTMIISVIWRQFEKRKDIRRGHSYDSL